MRNLKEIILLISFEAGFDGSKTIRVVNDQGFSLSDFHQYTQHLLLFYEYVFQQNIK